MCWGLTQIRVQKGALRSEGESVSYIELRGIKVQSVLHIHADFGLSEVGPHWTTSMAYGSASSADKGSDVQSMLKSNFEL